VPARARGHALIAGRARTPFDSDVAEASSSPSASPLMKSSRHGHRSRGNATTDAVRRRRIVVGLELQSHRSWQIRHDAVRVARPAPPHHRRRVHRRLNAYLFHARHHNLLGDAVTAIGRDQLGSKHDPLAAHRRCLVDEVPHPGMIASAVPKHERGRPPRGRACLSAVRGEAGTDVDLRPVDRSVARAHRCPDRASDRAPAVASRRCGA